jgi:hypothetical protein
MTIILKNQKGSIAIRIDRVVIASLASLCLGLLQTGTALPL